jgi:ATP-dependent Clp protease adaptor protein ClpS
MVPGVHGCSVIRRAQARSTVIVRHHFFVFFIPRIAMPQEQSGIKERQRTDLREPRRFKVTIYNDDFTTMEFVVLVLKTVFHKSEAEAEALMMQVHHGDKAVVGVYSYDIASSKVNKATRMARDAGFPLRLTCEPE